ncbi:hypothetical protein HY484_01015 [Candidatus Woesearchaeota archaeon]|nr:hypothetical protein [Candidatus Woesearchaeota archaeon]
MVLDEQKKSDEVYCCEGCSAIGQAPLNPVWSDGKPKSELELLLEKNAYTVSGLTGDEHARAVSLIANPVVSDDDCWVCPKGSKDKAIYDTGICKGHAYYALAARK